MNPYLKDLQAFADLLAACNVIHESAVHDAEDYDGEETLCCIAEAHSRLMAEETAICESLERERDEAREACDTCDAYLLANEQLRIDLGKIKRQWDETRKERDRLAEALRSIKNELGVPQPEYPAPVANAVKIADEALQSLTPNAKL